LYNSLYYLKKSFAIYPGRIEPVSAPFLADHYRWLQGARAWPRAAIDALVALGFQAWIPFRAKAVQKKFGFDDTWRRRTEQIAKARFVDPNDIALFRIEREDQLDEYMRRFEDAGLNKVLNPTGWTRDCVLADKIGFYRRCDEHGLPSPGMVATVIRGKVGLVREVGEDALIAKPANGEGGNGVQMLGVPVSAEALEALLDFRLGRSKWNWVVQPRVPTNPALADIALSALPTVRIVTIVNESGAPEVVSATVRVASDPDAHVDNMKAGGILAPVDLETGALGVGCKGYGGGDYETHPVTGAPITGRILPQWTESKALAIRAHAEAFSEYRIIGWDVAMTEDGPLLLEGNGKPGVLMPQRAARRGLGVTRYGELIRYHLAALEGRSDSEIN